MRVLQFFQAALEFGEASEKFLEAAHSLPQQVCLVVTYCLFLPVACGTPFYQAPERSV